MEKLFFFESGNSVVLLLGNILLLINVLYLVEVDAWMPFFSFVEMLKGRKIGFY